MITIILTTWQPVKIITYDYNYRDSIPILRESCYLAIDPEGEASEGC